jgi:hypothetical protein
MRKQMLTWLTVLLFVLLGAVSLAAQDQQAAPAESAKPEKMAMPAKHAMMAAPETLSGTISMVDADKKIVVVTGSDGVPYDFMVSKATKIMVGGNKAMLNDLSGQTSKQASVTFMAEKRKGNIAKSIEVTP